MIASINPALPVATLLAVTLSTGCQSPHRDVTSQSFPGIGSLPPGATVLLRMPAEDGYPRVLFQRPSLARNDPNEPADWMTSKWLEDDSLESIFKHDPNGMISFSILTVAAAQTFLGTAAHGIQRLLPKNDFRPDRQSVIDMAAVARGSKFDDDLKLAIRKSLEANQLVVVGEADLGSHGGRLTPDLTLNVHVVNAGMPGGGAISRVSNPRNPFLLELRVEAIDAAGTSEIYRLEYASPALRFTEWSEDGAQRFAATRAEALRTVATRLGRELHVSATQNRLAFPGFQFATHATP